MRSPDFVIGPFESPYMLRWYMIPRNRWFGIYWHRFLRHDDDRALHDHPWWSFSIVLRGGYFEITRAHDGTEERKWYGPGSIKLRSAKYSHRIELAERSDGSLVHCETLFLMGPRVREWGFLCPQGWVHWRQFVSPGDHGNVGKGCE